MKSRANLLFPILITLIVLSSALHLDESPNPQLQALKDKQQFIKDQVKAINAYSANIDSQLQNAKSDEERVQILQNALGDQRQTVFDLKNKVIYPFNESQTACQQLTDKQKSQILEKITITRNQLNKLQQINNKLSQGSSQVQSMNDCIKKQLILLDNLQEILKTKCKQNLSPTIFQSNLNAKNWILGPQTMNDLEQQYAQRALIFHNITNCPLETPFYDPNAEICIQCQEPNPLFNMYSKECTICQEDEELDPEKKVCKSRPHYTNFTKVKNWYLDGGNLPEINNTLTPCPDSKPYFNGVICVQCELPLYWNVSANLCKKCESGYGFDLNTKKCQKILKSQLTILQNTKWISQNLTKVIEERVSVLQKNKTSKNYEYCPNSSPYFDGITCISCDYFDMDRLKCTQPKDGTQYDDNMRRFLIPQPQMQTNPTAQRYISANKLVDSNLSNCNSTAPYYDGIACIICMRPFDIFNVDQRKCVACNHDEVYVQNLHTCQLRKKIRISQNFDKLLATPKVTVPQYKQSLIKTINDNPEAIIYPCQQKNQYSNLTDCFPCPDAQYFNIETLACQPCDGVYFDNNQTCKAKVYIFTNLKAPNIVDMEGTTVQAQNNKTAQFIKSHPESFVCPLDKPYALQNRICGTCPDLFSYSDLKCKSCPEWNIYVADTRKCVQAKMLVNFTDVHKILVNQNETLSSFKEQQQLVKNQNPNVWKICPGDRPYTENRQYCFNCTQDSPYFNYTTKQCQGCPDHYIFDPQTVRCVQQFFITLINSDTQPRMLGYDNYTMADYRTEQQAYKKNHPFVLCNETEPFGTITGCQQCNEPNGFFDIKKKQCSDVKYLINFQKISPEYILPNDRNLDSFIAAEEKFRKQSAVLTKKCPDATPYTTDRVSCFNCSQGEYFNFANGKCQKCPQNQAYVKQAKTCKQLFYVTKITAVTEPNMKGYSDYTMDNYRKDQADIKAKSPYQQCPDTAPYGTVDNGCQLCQQPTPYFDIKKQVCSDAKKLINFSKIGNNYLLADTKTLSSYQQNEKNFKLFSETLTTECPPETPFTSDRDNCFVCKQPDSLFNFETKKCESCPLGSSFSNDKKKCLRLFYITNFNADSQKKMVGTTDYGIVDYKADQDKLRKENPFQDCNVTDPYGTLDGCKRCTVPEEYFDIKNRICTAVKKLINFDAVGNNYILKEGKPLSDYRKDQQNYQTSSDLPTLVCPSATPFTNNRDDCFVCTSPNIYFNFETNACQKCEQNEGYDPITKRCVVKQFYTLFTSATEKKLLQGDNYNITQYKADQAKIKSQSGSAECPIDRPFSTQNDTIGGCMACNDSKAPYFNIKTQSCQGCRQFYQYYEDYKCKDNIILTNTKEMVGYFEIDNYTKYNVEKMNNFTYLSNTHVVDCPASTPFYSIDNVCISCNSSDLPIFNLKDRICMYLSNMPKSNPQSMKFYIESGSETLATLKRQIDILTSRGVKIDLCPQDRPYLSHNQCITCPQSTKYFDLATKMCTTCGAGQKCVAA